MKKYTLEIKWALIFMAMSLVWMWLEKLSGLHSQHIGKHHIYTNFIAIPAIAVYVLALIEKRKKFYHDNMTWLQGFICGLIITLFVTMLNPLVQIITAKLITPEFFQNIIKYSVEKGKMTTDVAESYFSLLSYIIKGLLGTPIMGVITSALVSFFIRRRRIAH